MKQGSFSDFLNSQIINFTCNGNCSNCGNCCSDILPIDDNEIYKIKQYINKYNIKDQKHLFVGSKQILDLTCPFRDNLNKKCTIYKVRPDICRSFVCSKSTIELEEAKKFFYSHKKAVSMRNVFFDGPSYEEILNFLIINKMGEK